MEEQAAAVLALVENYFKSPAHFILDTDSKPLKGGQCFIYALEIEQIAKRVCIRTPKTPYDS
jgi:hypothetical protein